MVEAQGSTTRGVENVVHRTSSRVLLIVAAFVLFLVPVAAIAAGGFDDVADDSVFKADIAWLADVGVTKGCNPPANTRFCPGSNVTREQMAAFMHRLAVNKVVDAATAVEADNADKLDGKDSTAFAVSGHDHDTAYLAKAGKAADSDLLDGKDSTGFLTKAAYDTDTDGVVDSAEIAVGHAYDGFYVDVAGIVDDPFYCDIGPMTFGRATTVVASGGLTLAPLASTSEKVYGDVAVRPLGASFWTIIESSAIAANLPGGLGFASVPIAAAATLDAGTYEFAVAPRGEDIQINLPDYYGECTLTVTAYTGLGPDIEFVGRR